MRALELQQRVAVLLARRVRERVQRLQLRPQAVALVARHRQLDLGRLAAPRQRALGLAAATLFVLVVSNASVSVIRSVVSDTIRLPVFVMIIAAAVTATELLMQAYSYELYQILGIFLPLITTNCIILGRADAFARKNPLPAAIYDGFMMGVGFGAVLVLLGIIRELLGT
ncbi:MAG: Rnf-Nqr domain containing protein, partial [Pseudomonadota bacterium]|nr:Rnf-Nqr domain containing protein [Pseudomonadota bacterium]